MATHSSTLAWRIPGMGEPGGLLSMGSQSRTRLMRLSSSSSILFSILEGSMATHSSILVWRIQWTEESGGLEPMESQRVT